MLDSKPLSKLIFIDLESTSQYPTFAAMPEVLQKIFLKTFRKQIAEGKHDETPEKMEAYYSSIAPLRAEWGKILCISIGTLAIPTDPAGDYVMTINSFSGDSDKAILEEFMKRTASVTDKLVPEYHFVGHAINLFDIPFITKRIILNRLPLPRIFDTAHLKPWEKNFMVDTLEVYKMGTFDGVIGQDHLAYVLGVESSKGDMDGGMVKDTYYLQKDLPRIVRYCEADILCIAEIYLRLKNMSNKVVLKEK